MTSRKDGNEDKKDSVRGSNESRAAFVDSTSSSRMLCNNISSACGKYDKLLYCAES